MIMLPCCKPVVNCSWTSQGARCCTSRLANLSCLPLPKSIPACGREPWMDIGRSHRYLSLHLSGFGRGNVNLTPFLLNGDTFRGGLCVRHASKAKRKKCAVQVEGIWDQIPNRIELELDTDEEDELRDVSDGEDENSTVVDDADGMQQSDAEVRGTWQKFDWKETADLLYSSMREAELQWDPNRRRFVEMNPSEGATPLEFLPPLIQPLPADSMSPADYLRSLQERGRGPTGGCTGGKQLLALLNASSAALGIYNEGALTHHKIITAYTVRKSQGRAQAKHLRHGGGGGRLTVGGNIRAKETRRLYTRINEKLKEWEKDIEGCELLFSSGGTRVWNEVFKCKDPPAVLQREDPRWQKIPISVKEPRMRELIRIFYFLSHGGVGRPYLPPQS